MSRRKATAPTHRTSESRRRLRHELREEQVAEQHPEREDQPQLERVRRGVRVDAFDHRLDEAVGDEEPSDLDETKLQSLRLLEISPSSASHPSGRLESSARAAPPGPPLRPTYSCSTR